MNERKNTYVTEVRQATRQLVDAQNKLRNLQREHTARDYSNSETGIKPEDLGPENEGITTAQVTAVVSTSVNAIDDLLAEGHATNLYSIV